MELRRPTRLRGMFTRTVSGEKLSDASGVEYSTDQSLRYQKVGSRTASLRPVITKEDYSSVASSSMGVGSGSQPGTLKRLAPSPRVETRTIVTRTESTTSPSGDKVVRTETTVATPNKTEVKTTETTVVDGHAEVKESHEVRPGDPNLCAYAEYQAPKVEALYATIQKKRNEIGDKDIPVKTEDKVERKDKEDGVSSTKVVEESKATVAIGGQDNEPRKWETLKKIGETTQEKTEVKVEEKTTIIATTTSSLANGDVKKNGSGLKVTEEGDSKLPLNIKDPPAEEKEDKILNVSAATGLTKMSASTVESKEEQRRKFLFGASPTDLEKKAEPSSIILKEMKESYDQSSVKDYDGIINDS